MATPLLALALPFAAAAAPPSDPGDLARSVPVGAVFYVESQTVGPWLGAGLEHPVTEALLAHPLGRLALADAAVTPEAALAFLDTLAGRPVLPTLASLTARGLAFGVLPPARRGAEPRLFLVLSGDDAEVAEDALGAWFDVLAPGAGVNRASLDTPREVVDGAEVFDFGGRHAIARDGADLVVTRTLADLHAALDARASRTPPLAVDPRFVTARAELARGTQVFAFVDLGALARHDPGAKERLDAVAQRPAPHFLLGPALTYLSRAETISLAARVVGTDLEVELAASGLAQGAGVATFPPAAPGPALLAARPNDTLNARLYRDAATLTRVRAELFPATAQPAFAKALSDLTPLLSGLDLYEEVLPRVSPWLRVVARDVVFDDGAAPAVALPAVCLVARVTEPEVVGAALVAAFQTTIGLTNVEAAQQGRTGFVLDLAPLDGLTLTRARLPRPRATSAGGAPAPIDLRYNLAPACVLVGDHFVLGTHHTLVAEVARELAAAEGETLTASAAPIDEVELAGEPLARLLEANRDTLALRAVLDEGKPRARAEAELDALAAALRSVTRATVATYGAASAGTVAARMRVSFGEARPR